MNSADDPTTVVFELDLTGDELRRRAEVIRALGSDWDPVEALRGEREAYDLLYSNLDEHQQAVYDDLVRHGLLRGRDAA